MEIFITGYFYGENQEWPTKPCLTPRIRQVTMKLEICRGKIPDNWKIAE